MKLLMKVDRICEAYVEFRCTKILTLIDFTKTFDKIERLNIIQALKMMKVHAGLIWRIATTMHQTEQRTDDGITIKTMHGVRQGCCLSPTLFIITMKLLIDQLGIPSYIHGEYADNLQITTDSTEESDNLITKIKDKGEKFGMIIGKEKTERLVLKYET